MEVLLKRPQHYSAPQHLDIIPSSRHDEFPPVRSQHCQLQADTVAKRDTSRHNAMLAALASPTSRLKEAFAKLHCRTTCLQHWLFDTLVLHAFLDASSRCKKTAGRGKSTKKRAPPINEQPCIFFVFGFCFSLFCLPRPRVINGLLEMRMLTELFEWLWFFCRACMRLSGSQCAHDMRPAAEGDGQSAKASHCRTKPRPGSRLCPLMPGSRGTRRRKHVVYQLAETHGRSALFFCACNVWVGPLRPQWRHAGSRGVRELQPGPPAFVAAGQPRPVADRAMAPASPRRYVARRWQGPHP